MPDYWHWTTELLDGAVSGGYSSDCMEFNYFAIPDDDDHEMLGDLDFVRSERDNEEGLPTKLLNNELTHRSLGDVLVGRSNPSITGTGVHDKQILRDKRYFRSVET